METWITAGVAQGEAGALARLFRTNDRGHEGLAAEGSEVERTCGVPGGTEAWTERVLVLRSPMHAQQQAVGLEARLGYEGSGQNDVKMHAKAEASIFQ